jgi:hypothetical protein
MPRMTKAEKLVEMEVERSFKVHGSGVQFDIMDLGKITEAGKSAAKAGTNIEEAVKAAIQTYRKN